MTYKTHKPTAFEKEVIATAYKAQCNVQQVATRFVMPPQVPTGPYSDAEEMPTNETVPFGEIVMEGVEIRSQSGHSARDGFWDKITYSGNEWLVRGGVVLKSEERSDA